LVDVVDGVRSRFGSRRCDLDHTAVIWITRLRFRECGRPSEQRWRASNSRLRWIAACPHTRRNFRSGSRSTGPVRRTVWRMTAMCAHRTARIDVKRTSRSGTADGSIGRKARLRGVASGKTGVRAIAVVPWQREIALTAVRGSSRSGGGREARCVSQRAEPTPGRLRARARAQLRAEVEARLT